MSTVQVLVQRLEQARDALLERGAAGDEAAQRLAIDCRDALLDHDSATRCILPADDVAGRRWASVEPPTKAVLAREVAEYLIEVGSQKGTKVPQARAIGAMCADASMHDVDGALVYALRSAGEFLRDFAKPGTPGAELAARCFQAIYMDDAVRRKETGQGADFTPGPWTVGPVTAEGTTIYGGRDGRHPIARFPAYSGDHLRAVADAYRTVQCVNAMHRMANRNVETMHRYTGIPSDGIAHPSEAFREAAVQLGQLPALEHEAEHEHEHEPEGALTP